MTADCRSGTNLNVSTSMSVGVVAICIYYPLSFFGVFILPKIMGKGGDKLEKSVSDFQKHIDLSSCNNLCGNDAFYYYYHEHRESS